jgi:hypothetical protein|tara:strand:- start:93 stop:686 length:594 start_codon:yes stop_codon:yes gene_type:complete
MNFFPLNKNIIGIRHGEALHNIVGHKYGPIVYSQFEDTTLTANGMRQAVEADVLQPELVLVSPLTRTLQTATLMFPGVPMVALECLKEYPQHTEICNRRSSVRILSLLFPRVDFTDCATEQQKWPNKHPHIDDKNRLCDYLKTRDEDNITIVTHSSWLNFLFTGKAEPEPELEHCTPYPICTKTNVHTVMESGAGIW